MSRKLCPQPPVYLEITEPFSSSEEAWFWFVRSQKARNDGARFERGMERVARPCYPDDVYRAVKKLAERKLIGAQHLKVLNSFGMLERPPDPCFREEERQFQLWDEALDRLSTELKNKKIVQ